MGEIHWEFNCDQGPVHVADNSIYEKVEERTRQSAIPGHNPHQVGGTG